MGVELVESEEGRAVGELRAEGLVIRGGRVERRRDPAAQGGASPVKSIDYGCIDQLTGEE